MRTTADQTASPRARHWTVPEVLALPSDGNRYEAVAGELLMTPASSARHQRVVLGLAVRLYQYAVSSQIGEVLTSPADIELGPDTLVQPDIFVLPAGMEVREWADVEGRLLLAVEVLSPSTARADRQLKRVAYQRAGIPEYWIVDPDARLVERWRPADERPEVLSDSLVWQPDAAHPPMVIDLQALFRATLER